MIKSDVACTLAVNNKARLKALNHCTVRVGWSFNVIDNCVWYTSNSKLLLFSLFVFGHVTHYSSFQIMVCPQRDS